MAYKFQLGGATLSGSATYLDDVASAADLKTTGGSISGSGGLTVKGTNAVVTAADDIAFNLCDEIIYKHNGSELKLDIDVTSNLPRMFIKKPGNGTDNVISLLNGGSNQEYALSIISGSNTGWVFNGGNTNGDISGSGNFTLSSNAAIGDDAEIIGNLTVNGTSTAIASTTVGISDVMIQVSGGAADNAGSLNSGYLFGQDSQTYGGKLLFVSSSEESNHLAFRNSSGAGIPLKAGFLHGDGSNITNISVTSNTNAVNSIESKTSGPFDTAQKGKTNIITNAQSGEKSIVLPSVSGLTAGELIRIKLAGAANATDRVKIVPLASDSPTAKIDNADSLLLMSPSASVDLIFLGTISGTPSFGIF